MQQTFIDNLKLFLDLQKQALSNSQTNRYLIIANFTTFHLYFFLVCRKALN